MADQTFYTELRYSDSAENIIRRYAAALRRLVARQSEDLLSGGRGEFGGHSEPVLGPMADGLERMYGHIDAFEATALGDSDSPERDRTVRNVLANVIADSNASAIAEAHVGAPKAREGKFDQEQGGIINGTNMDLADKLWHLTELFDEKISFIINSIAIILRDIGLFGNPVAQVSLAEVGYQLENKLDYVLPRVDGLKDGQTVIDTIVRRIEQLSTMTQQEVYSVEQKADTLGDLLGRTLVGEGWIVDPNRTRSGPNKVPPRDIKQELHDIEDRLKENCDIIENPPDGGNGGGGVGHDKRIPVLRDRRLKKIFVYAEDTFSAKTSKDRRRIRFRTPAFDLSGWLDLSRLRGGDVVEVDVRVSFADRRDVLFARTEFDQAQLVSFGEFAKGRNYLSGNNLLIVLRQKVSADDFANPIELAYQFIVESA
jgi:hypothetical protein